LPARARRPRFSLHGDKRGLKASVAPGISGTKLNCAQEPECAPVSACATMMSMNTIAQLAMPAPPPQLNTQPVAQHRLQPIDPDAAWRQVLARSPEADFFYAVTTTQVFCRPECSSKRPLRANVRFFATAGAAEAAGFRPCQRCKPDVAIGWGSSLEKIRRHLESNRDRAVPLAELARLAGSSPFTVQRLFKRKMGVSPLQYQRALRAGALRASLKQGRSVTTAIYDAGFNSSSRAYEGAPLGMTPSRFAQGGRGERIGYTAARTPFGWMIVGATERGLCWLSLAGSKKEAEAALRAEFPAATLRRDATLARWIEEALVSVREGNDLGRSADSAQSLDLRGTVFQLRVWQALRQIPRGETRTYSEVARGMGEPKATRAVARACALNRVALVVPCHRVVGASGSLTGYRWGVERKQALLEAERG
jgi:AraC family transcriptional regulator, regulatory protein of adaptative response / methylated-DNA-[protein]-cysteine methyltransferase